MSARAFACLALALASPAFAAAPAVRYNDPPPDDAPGPLEARVLLLVAEVAKKERREAPAPDARLARAASEIARRLPPDGRPQNELVEESQWLHGIVEPPPHLVVLTLGKGQEAAMEEELRSELPQAFSGGRYKRVAVGTAPRGSETAVVIALAERWLDLAPVPRALPFGGPAELRGRLLPPFQRAQAVVTGPDGQVTRLAVEGDATNFAASFRCGAQKGRYQLEVLGEDRFGPSVLANFPVHCGMAAPQELPPPRSAPRSKLGEAFTDAADAENSIVALLNADRARAALPALAVDAKLREAARQHSADMRANGFVGHVSPRTGSAADRVKRVGVAAQLVQENVARAYTPGEAQRGLMNSPGHRANVLSREATQVGVGVVVAGEGGQRELFVTQLFVKPVDALGPASRAQVRREIDAVRKKKGLGVLAGDGGLDRLAQEVADQLAKGVLEKERAGEPLDRAMSTFATRYKAVRSVVVMAGSVPQIVEGLDRALADATLGASGIGLASSTAGLHAVIVLAAPR